MIGKLQRARATAGSSSTSSAQARRMSQTAPRSSHTPSRPRTLPSGRSKCTSMPCPSTETWSRVLPARSSSMYRSRPPRGEAHRRSVATEYLDRMGWSGHDQILVRHNDTPTHDHIHILVSRVGLDGQTADLHDDYGRHAKDVVDASHPTLKRNTLKSSAPPGRANPPQSSGCSPGSPSARRSEWFCPTQTAGTRGSSTGATGVTASSAHLMRGMWVGT